MGVTVWVNGVVGDGEEAKVGALDHGVTVGDGVFETLSVRDGVPFALTRHLRRLERSASVLALHVPCREHLIGAVSQTLAAAGHLPRGRLRITLTGGPGPLGSDRADVAPTLVVAAGDTLPWPHHIEAVSVPWPRNERSAVAGAKTTSYAENVVALAEAHRRGAMEAILPNTRGELCEGTGSNVVLVLDGELVTPALSSGCLAGITRELLLEWARDDGLPIREADLAMAALGLAEDVLLTSSTRDVQHVDVVDGRPLAGSGPGAAASALFAGRAAERSDP